MCIDKNTDCDTSCIFTAIHAAYEKLVNAAPNTGTSGTGSSSSTANNSSSSKSKPPPSSQRSNRHPNSNSNSTATSGGGCELNNELLREILKKFGVS